MKCRDPPDKFGVLYRIVTYRIPWFHKHRVITPWFLVLSQYFRDGMGLRGASSAFLETYINIECTLNAPLELKCFE